MRGAVAGDHAPLAAGRMCPADYRYPPSVLDRSPEFAADVLYVVGGLYGNLAALDRVEQLAEQEGATVVFNGDFHWFDAEPAWFAEIETRIAHHRAMRGNVETEAARLLVWRAGDLKDKGRPNTRETSIAKLYASEAAQRAADNAIQIHGGYGFSDEFPVERYWRDARVNRLYEGTTQIQKLIIGRFATGIDAIA